MKGLSVVSVAILCAPCAFAGKSADDCASQTPVHPAQVIEQTVFITGSLIPQRIQVRRVGTTTFSPVRIIDRQEIDQTGRHTTPGAFVNEPSVRVIGH